MMNGKHTWVLCLLLLFFACRSNDEQEIMQQQKALAAQNLVLAQIKSHWHFHTPQLRPDTQALVRHWTELRQFSAELAQPPGGSLGGFQQKAKTLSQKALELNQNIPADFDKPEVKARIAALSTKLNQINLYLHNQQIPAAQITALIAEADAAWSALYREMNEIVQKSKIPLEEGESDILLMQDTTRAIPDLATP